MNGFYTIKTLENLKNFNYNERDYLKPSEIIAIDNAIAALQKQIAKKPIYSDYDDNGYDEIIPHTAKCPTCGNEFEFGTWNEEENHHCVCGQAMYWSDK